MSRDTDEHYRLMTEGPVAPLIVRLAIPTTLSMLVTSAYNLVDTAFVGTLGTSASGAVGVVFGFMSIVQAFGFLFGQGAGSIVARLLGAHDTRGADRVASTGVALSLATGVVMAVAGTVWLPTLVTFMGATPTIAPFAQDYVRFILVAAPIMCADFTMNQILRYEGKAALGMVALMCGCVLNVALDALLMFHLNMGIAGAGLSTTISELVSFCILLAMFLTGRSVTHLSPANVTLAPRLVLDILGTGLPSLIRQGLNSVNTMLLNLAAAPFGDAAVAAMSIVGRIVAEDPDEVVREDDEHRHHAQGHGLGDDGDRAGCRLHAGEAARPVVEARDRLEALADAEGDGEGEEDDAADDAHRGDGGVAEGGRGEVQ